MSGGNTEKRKYRPEYDVIRIIACFGILIFHYQTRVCGVETMGDFVYPNEIFPRILMRFQVSLLGEPENVLFFMLSGAVLMNSGISARITYRDLRRFYQKRFMALMPMFYIAWLTVTLSELIWKGWNGSEIGAPWRSLFWSLFGMDGYALIRGWSGANFYQVGEWYLGCILLCYLLWPFVRRIRERLPKPVFLGAAAILYLVSMKYDLYTLMRLCQMIAGGCLTECTGKKQKVLTAALIAASAAGIALRAYLPSLTIYFMIGCAGFLLLSWISEKAAARHSGWLRTVSAYTYPAFLVHHKVIYLLSARVDLERLPRRYNIGLFAGYLLVTLICAVVLKKVTETAIRLVSRNSKSV